MRSACPGWRSGAILRWTAIRIGSRLIWWRGTSYRFRQTGVLFSFGPVTGVTLYDPKILGIYDDNGIKLPGTSDDNGGTGDLGAEGGLRSGGVGHLLR